MFYNVGNESAPVTYLDIVGMEELLELENVYGNKSFIVSPSAKAILRTTVKGENANAGFIMQNNEIEGYPVYSSSNVTGKGVVMGNFSDYVIGQWGGIGLTIDTTSQAIYGKIRLVVNAFFDAKPRREEAFVKKILL